MFDGSGPRDFLYQAVFKLYLKNNYPDFYETPVCDRIGKFGEKGTGTYNRIVGEASNAAQAASEDIVEQLVENWLVDYKDTLNYYLDPKTKHSRKTMVDTENQSVHVVLNHK